MNVDEERIQLAVNALKKSCEEHGRRKEGASSLFDKESDVGVIFLQVSMKKIPRVKHITQIKINLPHPCWIDPEDSCLFVLDLDKKKPDNDATIHHYRILLQNCGIAIREIIPLNQLKTEYLTYESRRHLLSSYGFFLCDGRLSSMLPVLLGKHFIHKRKMPMNVNLQRADLKKIFFKAISKTSLAITGHGSSCICQVANFGQSNEEISSNVIAAVKEIKEKLPGGATNISGLGLKTQKSITVPIYLSSESGNLVELPPAEKAGKPVIGELTTEDDKAVMVYPSGRVVVFPADELASDEEETEKRISKKYNPRNVARKAAFRKWRSLKSKEGKRNKLLNQRKPSAHKRKSLPNLSFKMKQTYRMVEASRVKTPSANLVSVKKRDMEQSFRKSLKGASPREVVGGKGNLIKRSVVPEDASSNRKSSMRAANKRPFTSVMKRSSLMAKHM